MGQPSGDGAGLFDVWRDGHVVRSGGLVAPLVVDHQAAGEELAHARGDGELVLLHGRNAEHPASARALVTPSAAPVPG